MAMCWERAVPLAFHLCRFYSSVVLVIRAPFPFGVWGCVWNSTISVPDHCPFTYFQYVLFYLCVCVRVCVSVCVFLAGLQCTVISYYICRQQIILEVVLRIRMILSLLLCFKCMHELLSSVKLGIHMHVCVCVCGYGKYQNPKIYRDGILI